MADESVDLIATDPPFNKGRDFHATPDSLADGASFDDRWRWIEDVQQDWVDAIERDWEGVAWAIEAARKSYGEDMAAFLCWLGVRLIEMHRILKPTGSIYLHCDATASHYIKQIMDSIFGRKQFRNEIVWRKYAGRKNNASRKFTTQHEVLFFYVKDDKHAKFNGVMIPHSDEEIAKKYSSVDDDGRRYRLAWGRSYQLTGENRRIYLDESPGRAVGTLWVEDGLQLNTSSKEKTGYPTQKPLALYRRIIAASSNPGDLVLDPFCGCATTPIAAELEGRRWFGMDLWEGALKQVKDRLQKEVRLQNPDARIDYSVQLVKKVPEHPADNRKATAPFLKTPKGKAKRERPAWQRMTKADMVRTLAEAQQGDAGVVVCVGCGVELAARYFELDHREPKGIGGEDWITNRVLLCGPCNGRKSHRFTLAGLRADNSKPDALGETWMVDALAAEAADRRAREAARAIRDGR